MNYRAVIVDAFGTIVRIPSPMHPYRRLLREGIHHGRATSPTDLRMLMMFDGDLAEAAEYLRIKVRPGRLDQIQAVLRQELDSIEAFPGALEAVAALQAHKILVGVCSNFAEAYGAPVKRLFPRLDAYTFSYQLGALKPDPVMYRHACEQMGVPLDDRFGGERVGMVGDSLRCDCNGPRALGINGIHLVRSGAGKITNLMDFAALVLTDV